MDLALNNLQRLICHKTHQTKPKPSLSLLLDPPWLVVDGTLTGPIYAGNRSA